MKQVLPSADVSKIIPVFWPCTVQVLFDNMIKCFPTLEIEHPVTLGTTVYGKLAFLTFSLEVLHYSSMQSTTLQPGCLHMFTSPSFHEYINS